MLTKLTHNKKVKYDLRKKAELYYTKSCKILKELNLNDESCLDQSQMLDKSQIIFNNNTIIINDHSYLVKSFHKSKLNKAKKTNASVYIKSSHSPKPVSKNIFACGNDISIELMGTKYDYDSDY